MPALIVPGPSNPEMGEISKDDLDKITGGFKKNVDLQSESKQPIIKIDSVYVPMSVIRDLVSNEGSADGDDFINIQFGVTLSNQTSCADDFQTDISNQITVIINRAKQSGTNMIDRTEIGDHIIAAGFKTNADIGAGGQMEILCCGKPGGGN